MIRERRGSPFRIALFGHPVSHSRSKDLFAALRAPGLPAVEYEPIDVPPGLLPSYLDRLRGGEWRAANVTVPHKLDAASLCDELDPRAVAAGAVNALLVTGDGRLLGTNTDGDGFIDGLEALGVGNGSGPRFGSAVVLGSGGAARGVAAALAARGTRPFVVAREPTRVDPDLAGLARGIWSWTMPGLAEAVRAADLIVQTTPLGTAPDVARMVPLAATALGAGQAVVDLVYNPWQTRFLSVARAQGALGLNGWPMLVHQAAHALEFWMGPGLRGALVDAAGRVETRDPRRGGD